ncbi:uncharacterized protein LOC129741999 [Uranotaenia lowii]|uniref:uncharacterized protein LOC129741999 n=1 Tax=Uranotaenia lowii TaxID=190385 RepID=UPI00247A6F68|nr:uncharacterized protein LOC129741999 [Uranotaenia lowii]
MKFLVPLLFLAIHSASAQSTVFWQYTYYKSFLTSLRECAEYYEVSNCDLNAYIEASYPSNEIVKKLIRCTLYGLGAWDDNAGVQENVIQSFFIPALEDTCYLDRTRECLKSIECGNVYDKAYGSFQCYYNHFGNLSPDEKFLPLSGEELGLLASQTFDIADLPQCVLQKYANGHVLDQPSFPFVLFTYLVRGGYYRIDGGLQLGNMFVQWGKSELLTPETQQCVEKAIHESGDSAQVDIVHRIYSSCLGEILHLDQVLEANAKLLRDEEDVSCSCNVCADAEAPIYNKV